MARIAIVGVGAIGAVIAALLKSTEQHELILCTRRPLSQLSVETPEGSIHIKYTNLTAPSQAEPVDWIVVATKTYDAPGAGAWLERLCKQGTPVAVIQNGVEHRERFASYVSAKQIVPVVIDCPAERRTPESLHQRGPAEFFIQADALGRSFAALFHGSAAQITLTADFFLLPGASSVSTPLVRSLRFWASLPVFFVMRRSVRQHLRSYANAPPLAALWGHSSTRTFLRRCSLNTAIILSTR